MMGRKTVECWNDQGEPEVGERLAGYPPRAMTLVTRILLKGSLLQSHDCGPRTPHDLLTSVDAHIVSVTRASQRAALPQYYPSKSDVTDSRCRQNGRTQGTVNYGHQHTTLS